MATIEETYAILDEKGRDSGLLKMRTVMDGRGLVGNEIEILPLNGWSIEGGRYRLQFLTHKMEAERAAIAV